MPSGTGGDSPRGPSSLAGILRTNGDKKDTKHFLAKSMNINCGLQQDTFQLEYHTVKSDTTASFIAQPSTRTNAQDSWSGANG